MRTFGGGGASTDIVRAMSDEGIKELIASGKSAKQKFQKLKDVFLSDGVSLPLQALEGTILASETFIDELGCSLERHPGTDLARG